MVLVADMQYNTVWCYGNLNDTLLLLLSFQLKCFSYLLAPQHVTIMSYWCHGCFRSWAAPLGSHTVQKAPLMVIAQLAEQSVM